VRSISPSLYSRAVTTLRLIVPAALVARVLALLRMDDTVTNILHFQGAALEPRGDVVICDVAREEVSVVVARLCAAGVDHDGAIVVQDIAVSLSAGARRAMREASGSPADAVLWEQVEQQVSESTDLSLTFLAFMVIATLLAAVGILTDSPILIVGAMVVGPEFGPLAALCVAVIRRRPAIARRAAAALSVGFVAAISASFLITLALRAFSLGPDELSPESRAQTFFISHPDTFSVLVALLAGVAGMLSLSTAKSGALVGVLISVTTIPAAANIGVAAAYRDWEEWRGAMLQLVINLSMIVLAGVATLAVERRLYLRRSRHRAGDQP
jgi:uncharacterized hydrophobic protein (TIGR00271 family)